jgi:hypothetical protein
MTSTGEAAQRKTHGLYAELVVLGEEGKMERCVIPYP